MIRVESKESDENLITEDDCLENLSDESEELQNNAIPIAALASYESSTLAYGMMRSSLKETIIRQTKEVNADEWMFQTVVQGSRQVPPLTYN